MNIHQLSYFVAASETKSFSKVASDFYISRQSVSQAVHSIENELGIKLVSSDRGRVKLTPIGEEFAKRAKTVVRSYENLIRDFSSERGGLKELRFAVDMNYLANSASPFKVVEDYNNAPSQSCRVYIHEELGEECYESVLQQDADLCLILSMERQFSGCVSYRLAEYPLGLLANRSNPIAKKSKLQVSDLKGQRLILPPGYAFMFYEIANACHKEGMKFEPAYVINDGEKAVEAVKRNLGCAITSADQDSFARENGMRVVLFSDPEFKYGIYLLYRKDSTRKERIMHFINAFKRDASWKEHGHFSALKQ